jgi:hypothetical protein
VLNIKETKTQTADPRVLEASSFEIEISVITEILKVCKSARSLYSDSEGTALCSEILPSFPSALQLRLSFGLLNNPPPFLPILHCSDDETSDDRVKK